MARLAFLGTGLIGGALAEAAARRGDDVFAWNRTRERAEALAEFGVTVCDTPGEAVATAERVHLAFPHDQVVEEILGLFVETVDESTVIVDHTTASPRKTAARGERLSRRGVRYLHAPVFMAPTHCRNATGMMVVSGPEDVFGDVREGLEEMTGKVKYVGEEMERAAAFKLFGNAMIVTMVGGLADVFAMAEELGLTSEEAFGLFSDFDPSGVLDYRGENMSKGDYSPSFELTMARKDVRLMLEAAGDQPLAVLPGLAERMDELIAAGRGGADLGVLSVESIPPRDE